jgi:hypothetical protein
VYSNQDDNKSTPFLVIFLQYENQSKEQAVSARLVLYETLHMLSPSYHQFQLQTKVHATINQQHFRTV